MTRSSARRPTNLSLDDDLLAKARDLKINVSRAAEEGIARAVRAEQERLWRIENAKAIADANAFVEGGGCRWPKSAVLMARFHVYRLKQADTLVVDLQPDLFDALKTLSPSTAPQANTVSKSDR